MNSAALNRIVLGIATTWGAGLVAGLAACTDDAGPRDAFVGTFAFASSSLQTDCAPVPDGHEAIDDQVEIELTATGVLALAIDDLTVPCRDETELEAAPRRVGCMATAGGITYTADIWIELSYARPSRLAVVKAFSAPAACSMEFSGLLTPTP